MSGEPLGPYSVTYHPANTEQATHLQMGEWMMYWEIPAKKVDLPIWSWGEIQQYGTARAGKGGGGSFDIDGYVQVSLCIQISMVVKYITIKILYRCT